LCTGDPCTITLPIEVISPCTANFIPRTLVIAAPIQVPNNGTLSFTAGSIQVNQRISGRHTSAAEGDGADVSLTATGNIIVGPPLGQITVSARNTNGTITLSAGGNIDLQRRLLAKGQGTGATATGGTVVLDATGTISSSRRGKIDARGRTLGVPTAGGQVTLDGDAGVTLLARVDVLGGGGGTVQIDSATGDVILDERGEVRANGSGSLPAIGGTITVNAAGTVNMTQTVLGRFHSLLLAKGASANAGTITIQSGEVIEAVARASVSGTGGDGGTIEIDATGNIDVRTADVDGRSTGGSVDIDAGGSATVRLASANSPGTGAGGGMVTIVGAGAVTAERIKASGGTTGGAVAVSSTGGDVSIERLVDVGGETIGGSLNVAAGAGDVELGTNPSAGFIASGPAGGEIEAIASGNLTARGDFDATVGGCIGLSAGGTLDTSQGTFSPAFGAGCASPSGAFLDVAVGALD
jgi:hypothetical protein